MLSVEEIESALRGGHETQGFEFKGPGARTDSYFLAKIARAALSLGNRRDGGHIVIGIGDDDPASLQPGLGAEELESWGDYEVVSRSLAVYADPAFHFELKAMTLSSGVEVVVIQVHEFADVPHLCAKGYDRVLRKGALYVRPRTVPETSEVADSVGMRDVLDLAIEKGVREFVQTAVRAGLPLGKTPGLDNEERYREEREGGWR
jgi:predicted HTH transcriptional regulator